MQKFHLGSDLVFLVMIVFVCISVCSTSTAVQAQIVFPDDEEQLSYSDGVRGGGGGGSGNPKPMSSSHNSKDKVGGEDDTADLLQDDYYDELFYGHQVKDPEKRKRQQGCLCISHLKDPHCGSDMKNYDNGCYFECAQKRNPRLYLRKWGSCS